MACGGRGSIYWSAAAKSRAYKIPVDCPLCVVHFHGPGHNTHRDFDYIQNAAMNVVRS